MVVIRRFIITMDNKKLRYFAFGGIVVFSFTIIYFVFSIFLSMTTAEKTSQPLFERFVEESKVQNFNSAQTVEQAKKYFENIKNIVDENPHIGAITLNVDSVPLLAYPISSDFIALNSNNEPILTGSSPMLKTQSVSIVTAMGQKMVVNAITYTLLPVDIYNSARIPILIILAYTLIILVVLLYKFLTKKDSKENSMKNMYNFNSIDYDIHNTTNEDYVECDVVDETLVIEESQEDIVEIIQEDERETIPVVFKEKESSLDDIIQKKTEIIQENDDVEQEESDLIIEEYPEIDTDTKVCVDDVATDDAYEIEDSTVSNVYDPMGLFSDVTGLGWASYLETRLDSELIRATSSEQDLTLVFIQVKNIDENIKAKKQIATILLEHFKFRDFVFEYTADSFAGILINIDLDQSMVISENIYTDINNYLKLENLNNIIGLGVSTRSLRIIPATRIITESQQALARSFEEKDLPIVAFKVNPEKYREFVTNNK